jgi:hypothetical protein
LKFIVQFFYKIEIVSDSPNLFLSLSKGIKKIKIRKNIGILDFSKFLSLKYSKMQNEFSCLNSKSELKNFVI